MGNRGISLKYKFLLVLTTVPFLSLALFVSIIVDIVTKDKLTYVYESSLSETQTKASALRSEIKVIMAQLQSLSYNLDPRRLLVSQNGRRLFENEKDFKGFYVFQMRDNNHFKKVFRLAKPGYEGLEVKPDSLKHAEERGLVLEKLEDYPNHVSVAVDSRLQQHGITQVVVAVFEKKFLEALFRDQPGKKDFLVASDLTLMAGPVVPSELSRKLIDIMRSETRGSIVQQIETSSTDYLTAVVRLGVSDLFVISTIDKDRALAAVTYIKDRAILFLIALTSVMVIVGILTSNRLTGALRELFQATTKVAHGDFNLKVPVRSRDEVGVLAQSFNTMAAEVKRLIFETAEKSRMESELKTAQTVQETLFPTKGAQLGSARIYGRSVAASECGGDWWHYTVAKGKLYVWIGDATGHGVPAALLTSAARAVAAVIEQLPNLSPGMALRLLNRAIHQTSKGQMMMTFFIACIDPENKTMTYANASHDPPFKVDTADPGSLKKSDFASLMDANNPRLGEKADWNFSEDQIQLDEGSRLIFYTDGITEAKNETGKDWGERRFLKSMLKSFQGSNDLEKITDQVFNDLDSYKETVPFEDDITLVLVDMMASANEKNVA